MNEKALRVLEYSKIVDMLVEQAGSECTRTLIRGIAPGTDPDAIRDMLAETTEAVTLITYKGPLPLGNFYDIRESLALAQKGGSLTMKQLLRVLYNMTVTRNVTAYLRGDLPELPILKGMAGVLTVFRDLEEDIDRCIVSEEEISDHASTALRNIRRDILRQNESIKARLNHILGSESTKGLLQDALVTIRDGRYVIPVKQEHRGKFPGIIHDQSASGATLFIEPQVIVNMNNELRQLEAAEKAEIERILAELSGRVGEVSGQLTNNLDLLTAMDLINAKGKLAGMMGAECPNLSEDGDLRLLEARHPLIDRKTVVPINIALGGGYRTLVITGPNTGGKTVTLKTTGLLAMMAQSGLFIPASSLSRLPVFRDIFADIGDEQSIEQSLSTFSSHMNNIVGVMEQAGLDTLVLLDELGAGTDPTEGAALAMAILERLREKGAHILATTHYTELKKYALVTPGVENASMEFDVDTLSPTYRLIVGIPGKSNAFEISAKLGLDGSVIGRAHQFLEGRDIQFEELLAAIEKDRRMAEAQRDEAVALNIRMKQEREELEKQKRRWEEQRENLMNKAREEARDMVAEAKDFSMQIRDELKELAKLDSLGERTRGYDEKNRRIKDAAGRYRERLMKEVNDNPVRVDDLKPGDLVKVLTLGQNGNILALPDEKGDVLVQVGRMKVKAHLDDLKYIPDSQAKKKDKGRSSYGNLYQSKARSISPSINLQGEQLDSAWDLLDKYLDDAFIAGLSDITVIHGRGEGILRTGLRENLKKHKHVDGFRSGSYNEGGDGVTIVTLRK